MRLKMWIIKLLGNNLNTVVSSLIVKNYIGSCYTVSARSRGDLYIIISQHGNETFELGCFPNNEFFTLDEEINTYVNYTWLWISEPK